MSSAFTEQVIHEFDPIIKQKTWKKEVKYRIRIVRRIDLDQRIRIVLDIRTQIITEKYATLTENGMYFSLKDINELESIIQKAKELMIEENKK